MEQFNWLNGLPGGRQLNAGLGAANNLTQGLFGQVLGGGQVNRPTTTASNTQSQSPSPAAAQYDTQISGLTDIMNTLPVQQAGAESGINSQYGNQRTALDTQKAQGVRNLDFAQNQVETQRAQSLRDLGNMLKQHVSSYNNMLGAYGAGNSSAAGLIGTALTQQVSRNRGDIQRGTSDQLTGIGFQRDDLQNSYDTGVKSLDDWKKNSLAEIAQKFAQQKLELQQKIAGATGDKAAYLQSVGQNINQQAIDALSALQNQYKTYAQSLVDQYSQTAAPAAAIPQNLQQYAVRPVTAGSMAGLNTGALQQNQEFSAAPIRRTDEYGNPVLG